MVFNARFPIPASEPSPSAEVVAGHFVLAAETIPNSVATVTHRNAGSVQTSKLVRPAPN